MEGGGVIEGTDRRCMSGRRGHICTPRAKRCRLTGTFGVCGSNFVNALLNRGSLTPGHSLNNILFKVHSTGPLIIT